MCMTLAAHSLEAWLGSQERLMRAWVAQAALDPRADQALLAKLEAHCRWLADERTCLTESMARQPAEARA